MIEKVRVRRTVKKSHWLAYRWLYELENINVYIKLFILEVKTNQMQIMMLNTYPFEIQF